MRTRRDISGHGQQKQIKFSRTWALNKGLILKLPEGYPDRQTSDNRWRAQRPKRPDNSNKD